MYFLPNSMWPSRQCQQLYLKYLFSLWVCVYAWVFMCVSTHGVPVATRTEPQTPWNGSVRRFWACCKLSPGPPEKQQGLLIIDPSLQPLTPAVGTAGYLFWCEMYSAWSCHIVQYLSLFLCSLLFWVTTFLILLFTFLGYFFFLCDSLFPYSSVG